MLYVQCILEDEEGALYRCGVGGKKGGSPRKDMGTTVLKPAGRNVTSICCNVKDGFNLFLRVGASSALSASHFRFITRLPSEGRRMMAEPDVRTSLGLILKIFIGKKSK